MGKSRRKRETTLSLGGKERQFSSLSFSFADGGISKALLELYAFLPLFSKTCGSGSEGVISSPFLQKLSKQKRSHGKEDGFSPTCWVIARPIGEQERGGALTTEERKH